MRRGAGVAVAVLLAAGCQTTPTVTPEQERAWQEKQERNKAEAAAKAEARARARAADLEARCATESQPPRTYSQERQCASDYERDKNAPLAIEHWRAAISKASSKAEICPPAIKISAASLHPEKDLGDASPAVVAECLAADKALTECRPNCETKWKACLKTADVIVCKYANSKCEKECDEAKAKAPR